MVEQTSGFPWLYFWAFHTYKFNNENWDFDIFYPIYVRSNFWAKMVSSIWLRYLEWLGSSSQDMHLIKIK